MPSPPAPPEPTAEIDAAVARGDRDAALALADDLVRRGALAAAAHGLERAVLAFPDEPRFLPRLLEVHLRWRDWDEFDTWSARALARFPARADLHFLVGQALEEQDKTCAAIRAYGRAARLDSDDVESIQRIARLFRMRSRPFLARRRLRRAILHHPETAALHGAVGYAYVDDGQYAKAVKAFKRAAELEPEDAPWLDHWGGALLLSERWRDAAAVAVRALKANPSSEKGWTVFAVAHRHLDNADKAERGFRKAVESARDASRAQGNLGLYLASLSPAGARATEATRQLEAALSAHPEWEEVRAALHRLKGLP